MKRLGVFVVSAAALGSGCSGAAAPIGGEEAEEVGRTVQSAVLVEITDGVADVWSPSERTAITYCVAGTADWGGAPQRDYLRKLLATASEFWEAQAGVNIYEVASVFCEFENTQTGPVKFVVRGFDGDGGASHFPHSSAGEGQRTVSIGRGLFTNANYPNFPKNEYPFIVHEFGHGLGLGHEQQHPSWVNRVAPGPGAPACDPGDWPILTPAPVDYCSIMTGQLADDARCGITFGWIRDNCPRYFTNFVSTRDGEVTRSLYGAPLAHSRSWTQVPTLPLQTLRGSVATNGNDTWLISAATFNATQGRLVHQVVGGAITPRNAGAVQISVPPDASNVPWAIQGAPGADRGTVRRWNGTSFVNLTNGAANCARSVAAGPSIGGTRYTWAIGCDDDASGNARVVRYDPAGGWVQAGSLRGDQIVVDSAGTPWLRNAQTGFYRGPLVAGIPAWQAVGLGVTAGSGGGAFRNPDILATDGRLYTYSYAANLTNPWLDRGPTPAPFTQITSGEPSLAIDTSGRLWMSAAP